MLLHSESCLLLTNASAIFEVEANSSLELPVPHSLVSSFVYVRCGHELVCTHGMIHTNVGIRRCELAMAMIALEKDCPVLRPCHGNLAELSLRQFPR